MTRKTYPLHEAARACEVEERRILTYVRYEWIIPETPGELDEQDIARVRLIRDLQMIFEVNDAAIPIILDLLDQLYSMQKLAVKFREKSA